MRLIEEVGAGKIGSTFILLLAAGIDALSLITLFGGPRADIFSLAAFKMARVFLSISAFNYKGDGSNSYYIYFF